MPAPLAGLTLAYGWAFALWSILWTVFNGLWLYNLATETGSFGKLRRWMESCAPGDRAVQAILVAFCFGALLEGSAGFGAPVAITAFLLVGLGFEPRLAVLVCLIANTAPVAFGGIGVPIVALAGVHRPRRDEALRDGRAPASVSVPDAPGLSRLGRRRPARTRRAWPAALVAGVSFAAVQFLVSNLWGPYATDVLSSLASDRRDRRVSQGLVAATPDAVSASGARRFPPPPPATGVAAPVSPRGPVRLAAMGADLVVMIAWSYFKLFPRGQVLIPVAGLHDQILISLYQKPYAAIFAFQPLVGGTAVLVTVLLTALVFRARPRVLAKSGLAALEAAARARTGRAAHRLALVSLQLLGDGVHARRRAGATGVLFPFVSAFLGWVACFLSGSDTSSNLLFGNLQVAAAHQLNWIPCCWTWTRC